ncbi:MAG: hypothetical protein FJW30_05490 [Acidobacteria bacterium]|nr:hypothetical protein [Acidobacteriota bacterium]
MQFFGQGKPSVGVVFDCDMGSRVETALALSLLYGFDGKNECRVVCVSSTRSNLSSAAFCEVVGRFYAGAVSAAFGSFSRTLPVGLLADGAMKDETPMLAKVLERKDAEGKPVYTHGMHRLVDTAESPALVRNALTAQFEQNAIVVLCGPPANLLRVAALPGSQELIKEKVRYLVASDPKAAMALNGKWPSPIYSISPSTGNSVLFPAEAIEKEFAWSPAHPVADAYKAAKPMPYDAETSDMAAVLYAMRPADKAWTLSEPQGSVRQVMLNPDLKADVLKSYIELASAKPVPRQPRFRRPVVDPTKAAPPAKPAAAPSKPELR